jgi:hypothetical protein
MLTLGDIILNIHTFVFGVIWAFVMVNAEGNDGWGGKSGWRLRKDQLPWLRILTFGRPINFLPVFACLTFFGTYLLVPAWSYAHNVPFSTAAWGELIVYFLLFFIIEDYIWFLVNPGFGAGKFSKKFVPWHPYWILGMPFDYWFAVAAILFCGVYAKGWVWTGEVLLFQLLLTMLTVFLSNRILPRFQRSR